ncbi:MAG: metalloregulator ArsR/SmtB family transcription factor [Candidatus Hatepunaea meridiana]|nr:metalloregulator ArsR/SmtB family transcription factor [Candidatus Hatepunaea meridiana]
MMKKATTNLRAQARLLKALAHESRLAIVSRLSSGPTTVGELVSMIGAEQSTVSKHLTVLKAAGIVDDERKGQTVEYHLVIPCVLEFLNCATKVIHERREV